ncbi:CMRF35-like molecule 1 [Rhea pennata]|uniref:CMRF35-like molecule 1 n=1 Tax=Rhea pennata TaxID=8795 RepID=UPI002E263018
MLEGLLVWTWLLLPGCRALTGPTEASGPLGGTVSVPCTYQPELAEAEKYWCRGSSWLSCSVLVQTAAPQAEARGDRVSLRDDRALHVFVVTMENLMEGDGDTYWCGIQRPWYDSMHAVLVSVLPVPTAAPSTTDYVPSPTLASTVSALNSSSPQAGAALEQDRAPRGAPDLVVLVLVPSVTLALLLSIVVGLRLRRASPGKTSGPRGPGRAPAPQNLYANTERELGSPEEDYENSPAVLQGSEKRREVSFSNASSSAADPQPIYMNVRPPGPCSGPRRHKAQRKGAW